MSPISKPQLLLYLLVFDEPAVGRTEGCRSVEVFYIVKIVRKGVGAGFEPMTCSRGVLRFRASRQCCTEAMSEVSFNSSPRLFGSLLFYYLVGVGNVYSLIYGITVVLGRLARNPRTRYTYNPDDAARGSARASRAHTHRCYPTRYRSVHAHPEASEIRSEATQVWRLSTPKRRQKRSAFSRAGHRQRRHWRTTSILHRRAMD